MWSVMIIKLSLLAMSLPVTLGDAEMPFETGLAGVWNGFIFQPEEAWTVPVTHCLTR